MKIKCLVVDDEPLARQLIENHIAKIGFLQVAATAPNALKAFEILSSTKIDLMILDIKMPNITGIDFLKTLKNPPQTIITTAYRDFAIESFELEVVDYLLKPILFERFLKSVERIARTGVNREVQDSETNQENAFLILKSNAKNHKVDIKDITYIESVKDYIHVHLDDGSTITTKCKISEIEQRLSTFNFLRIHRSFLIHTGKINAFNNAYIEVNKVELPIGINYKTQIGIFLNTMQRY